jgi:hypothetical protein
MTQQCLSLAGVVDTISFLTRESVLLLQALPPICGGGASAVLPQSGAVASQAPPHPRLPVAIIVLPRLADSPATGSGAEQFRRVTGGERDEAADEKSGAERIGPRVRLRMVGSWISVSVSTQ